jgi:hypothetical protein
MKRFARWSAVPAAIGLALAISACGDVDETDDAGIGQVQDGAAANPASADADAGADSPAPQSDATGAEASQTDASGHHLVIQWDYRYDSQGFLTEVARRAVLQQAASIWGQYLRDDFETIPAGTEVLVRNPETPAVAGTVFRIDYPIDDLAVFVGSSEPIDGGTTLGGARASAAIGSVTDVALSAKLQTRFYGADFSPWTGWLSFNNSVPWFFDPTPDTDGDIPADQFDVLTVALHELGHVLGIGACDAFTNLVDANGRFAGPKAVAVYGGPVPLSPDRAHLAKGTTSAGRPVLMDPGDRVGTRNYPTPLDVAMLADIGYEVVSP